ncbi:hypothetical protein KGF56_001617 [Candida oxycetoniae]|uniref:DUF3533 domain-containing protein n=1 Tax=Candida oxycetoniae TaxID=497107 RepID=A0AAI9SZ44_9ASCO|nr:uncharacterized protein KGF56_001617 [Candida oxycetoniae]KAI3405599.2 hypothetical protein KGF56_001617 [Candida oxycetoniae]
MSNHREINYSSSSTEHDDSILNRGEEKVKDNNEENEDGEQESSVQNKVESSVQNDPEARVQNDPEARVQNDPEARVQNDPEARVQNEPKEGTGIPRYTDLSKQLEPDSSRSPSGRHNGYSFFSREYQSQRRDMLKKFLFINIALCLFILCAFSVYWGSFYLRNRKFDHLKMLVVIEDDQVIEGIEPVFGNTLKSILQSEVGKKHGQWHIYNTTEFQKRADKQNNSIDKEIIRVINRQEYWLSLHVRANASYNYHNALSQGDTSYNITANTVVCDYETGRDFLNMGSYIVPQVQAIEKIWFQYQPIMTSALSQNIEINSSLQIQVLSSPLQFLMIDRVPWTDTVLVAPCQVGFIYMIIITFFGFSFFSEVHQKVAKSGLNKFQFLIWRYFSSIVTYIIISLFFGLVTLAFQVDFTVNYGKPGFLVYWSIAFLTMCAVGLANEIVAMLIISVRPPLLGFWMLSWVVLNISPTFGPMALMNRFYRYGYGMPIYNSFQAAKTVFFDVYKGDLGRNFGILVAWWALLTAVFPVVVVYFGKTMAKKAQAAAKAQAEMFAEKQKEEGTIQGR